MRRKPDIIILFFLLIPGISFSQNLQHKTGKNLADSILTHRGELYIGMPASLRKSYVQEIPALTPDRVTDSLVFFYINAEQFREIHDKGLEYEVFTAPSLLVPVEMADDLDEILAGEAYPTYQQYLDLMTQFRDMYPSLCKIDTIGYSIAGKLILSARLQRGNYEEGDRPVVFYSSTMHGDETIGYSLMLMLINEILKNADISSQVSAILDDAVLIINPLSNPDGTYFQSDTSLFGSKRFNLSNIDLNRNFPDVRLGINYADTGLEKENAAMVSYMEKFRPTLSANFHGGAEVLNYPWDTWYREENIHADDEWFINICKDYVDTARNVDPSYLRTYTAGYVFGSDWYWIPGGRQDFVTYCLRGRELTIELSNVKTPVSSQIKGFWAKNHHALINLIGNALYGIYGIVTDSISDEPVKAKIEIPGYDRNESHIFSNPGTGMFFRFLPDGVYEIEFSAEGYLSKSLQSDVVKNQRTELIVELVPDDIEIPDEPDILVKSKEGTAELEIELKGDDSEVFTIELFDHTGRKLIETIIIGKTGTIQGAGFHGIYILKVRSDYQEVRRLVFF